MHWQAIIFAHSFEGMQKGKGLSVSKGGYKDMGGWRVGMRA